MNNLELLFYGSIFHDIGKLIIRKGRGGTHSQNSVDFFETMNIYYEEMDLLREIVGNHHEADLSTSKLEKNHLAYIVCEADNIAAGCDRRKIEDTVGFDSKTALKSVFNLIDKPTKYAYKLRKWDLELQTEANFPVNFDDIVASKDKYEQLNDLLENHMKNADLNTFEPNKLLSILKYITSYVPSSTCVAEIPDISLYSHLKLTTAISACMFLYFASNNIENYKDFCYTNKSKSRKENMFILLNADISGIQNYIYTIKSSKAAKTLKARSFTLEIYAEHIIDKILEKLYLTRANLLYSGGGHFYLLLPNTTETKDSINKAKEDINNWFIKKYSTELYIEFGIAEFSALKMMGEDDTIASVFANASREVSKGKLNRYSATQLSQLLKIKEGDENKECSICGVSNKTVIEEEGAYICQNCRDLENLGGFLNKTFLEEQQKSKERYLFKVQNKKEELSIELPSVFDKNYYLIPTLENITKTKEFAYAINSHILPFDSINLAMGNYVHANQFTFDKYANSSTGIKRLGVLRADVDNLGQLFSKGIKEEKHNTLTRSEMLSVMLSHFFKSIINKIANGFIDWQFSLKYEEKTNEPRKISVIYSGGDDVFVVGEWQDVLEFGIDLYNSFAKFTCEKLTFSAGFGMFDGKFPISQMARITGELEGDAKANDKNSIALFGSSKIKGEYEKEENSNDYTVNHVYKWDKFINDVCNTKLKQLQSWIDTDEENGSKLFIGTSAIYRLVNLLTQKNVNMAKIAYFVARAKPSNTNKIQTYDDFRKNIMSWALNAKQELITALMLFVYLQRGGNN